jgi:hypothetical protein
MTPEIEGSPAAVIRWICDARHKHRRGFRTIDEHSTHQPSPFAAGAKLLESAAFIVERIQGSRSEADMAQAVNRVKQLNGGIVVCAGNRILTEIADVEEEAYRKLA